MDGVQCAGCKRWLIEKTTSADGLCSFRRRPFCALIVTRRRDLPEGQGAITLPDGQVLHVREYPNVCSQACVQAVVASWPRLEPEDARGGWVIAGGRTGQPRVIREGNEIIAVQWDDRPTQLPSAPIDEWGAIQP